MVVLKGVVVAESTNTRLWNCIWQERSLFGANSTSLHHLTIPLTLLQPFPVPPSRPQTFLIPPKTSPRRQPIPLHSPIILLPTSPATLLLLHQISKVILFVEGLGRELLC